MQNVQAKENNKVVIDFSHVPATLLSKMKLASSECLNPTLVEISKKELFDQSPNSFDLILTQTNPESQMIIYNVLSSELRYVRPLMDYLVFFKDRPEKQRKLIEYAKIPDIIYDEFFAITMINIDDDYVEENLRNCFKLGLIENRRDFKKYYCKYLELSNENMGMKKVLTV